MKQILSKDLIFVQLPSAEMYWGKQAHTEIFLFILRMLLAFSQAINEKNDDFQEKNWFREPLKDLFCRRLNTKHVRS